MFINKETLTELLTKDHIKKICQALGSDYKTDAQGNLIFNTMICHEGGNSWKLYYYHKPNKRFKCYTCNDSFDVVGLVLRAMRLRGQIVTYFQALSYVASLMGYEPNTINALTVQKPVENDLGWMKAYCKSKRSPLIRHPKILNEHILEVFSYVDISEWENENISSDALQKFQIGYWDKHNSITIPHRYYADGTLVGIKERYIDEEMIKQYGKYVPVTIQGKNLAYPTGLNLYGLYYTKEEAERTGKLVIFESEKSVLKCESYFEGHNFSCAACGSSLSKTQIEIIKQLNVKEVMLAFDKEYTDPHSYEAEAYKNKLTMLIEPLVNLFTCYLIMDSQDILKPKDSPADVGKEGLLQLMNKKIEITHKDILRVRQERSDKR